MRRATDLPVPGAPVTRAKPPSPTSCSTRQQKDSMRRRDVQRLDRHLGRERVPLEAVEGQQLLVHRVSSSSLRRLGR